MAKIDYEFHTTIARVRRYQQVPLIGRLRWLEDICIFTKMVRQAPVVKPARKRTQPASR